jgi:transcriptional regulator with GAF, ATPase, and Fis domain
VAEFSDEFVDALLELSRLMVAEEGLDKTLARVAILARQTMNGCDTASVTLADPREPTTVASTSDLALTLDHAQYRADEGPCLHAYRTCQVVPVPDMAAESRWAAFTDTALQHSIHSSLSLPLVVDDTGTGALNLYAPIGPWPSLPR